MHIRSLIIFFYLELGVKFSKNFGMTMSSSCSMNCLTDMCYSYAKKFHRISPVLWFQSILALQYNVDICLYTLLAMLHNAQHLKSVLERDF
ncbi:hypothetical protein G4B88_027437 [Cannabis sativa]|uniref:Uncharacterized protein n=1 Tax=Cannabis sativa TaxID=3483 RepID=A0A7J6HQX7_CANSA|nr:hypothetical protein G4B88_027437 [Cannabis sativa]